MFLIANALAGGLPAIAIERRRADGRLHVVAPAGEHVAPEAPVSGWVAYGSRRVALELDGASLGPSLPLPLDLGRLDEGEAPWLAGGLTLSLCEDGGTSCRQVDIGFAGELARRGRSDLPVHAVLPKLVEEPLFDHWATVDDIDRAFAQAAVGHQRVLLDFSAVWCPPCNLLAAEVLHDHDDAAALEGFQVVMVDADSPDSFVYKDRYDVGGYPTMVVATPQGAEVGRLVGYPGEAEALAWLAEMTEQETLEELLARLPGVPAEEAGVLALSLHEQGHDEPALALAQRADDGVEARIVRLALEDDASQDHLTWLLDHAEARWEDWLWTAYGGLDELPEELQGRVADVLEGAVATAEPALGADLLYVLAGMTDDNQALYGAAASLLASSLSGDRLVDRGHLTFLASLYVTAGAVESGLAVLDEAASDWPDEFTWPYAKARHLASVERYVEAEEAARRALEHAYGDNALRATGRLAGILVELGREHEARQLLVRTLDETQRPSEGLEVRTWRYLEQLEEQLDELDASESESDGEAG